MEPAVMIRSRLDDRETGAKVSRHDRDHRLRNGKPAQRSEGRRGRGPQSRSDRGPAIAASGQPCDSARRGRICRRHGRAAPHRARCCLRGGRACRQAVPGGLPGASAPVRYEQRGRRAHGARSPAREGDPVRPQAWPEDPPHGLEHALGPPARPPARRPGSRAVGLLRPLVPRCPRSRSRHRRRRPLSRSLRRYRLARQPDGLPVPSREEPARGTGDVCQLRRFVGAGTQDIDPWSGEQEIPADCKGDQVSSNHIHTWEPIWDLPEDWKTSLQNANVLALMRTWHERMGELRTKDLYKTFVEKLKRQWAIETGVLEDIYTLSEGATLALIQGGLDAALITHGDTDGEPEDVILKIKDQHLAIQGLYQFVSGQRPLGTSYIKELHQVLTAHQGTYLARDTLGNLVQRALIRGAWKLWPNNVEHPDGTLFEYCTHEQVSIEMERLVSLHESHVEMNVPPDIEAAWIHHRFTLIHPFTDGNGRVARCLATLMLLKENWLPLLVTRKERTAYIDALRAADSGNLKPLVNLFGELQTRAIREALSLSEDVVKDSTAIEEILESAKQKFNQRRLEHDKQIRKSISTADSLVVLAAKRLEEIAAEVQELFVDEKAQYKAYEFHATSGSGKAKYHYHQIIQCASELHYFANRS